LDLSDAKLFVDRGLGHLERNGPHMVHLGRVDARFRFDRDPNDEPFIELAIAG
jgi:hypothetical protein